ncbi:GTP-binding protein [Paenibacillus lignilyticus]|uniref:TetM/TetW/TetO/TetS family tetracycline resistance ribosomal protection protein n=1 Tax=Paenibacillus lignilyticus TaxID=1172615 RepID=A0ABS5CGI7_9BACL|nr:TetM/TetW/TetO/TetS family tetracycline resistance ribosomal protection protein [Paenibacillus lignilyticus]MBP3964936.1 TetM/TetW/TetO/TetS family tetracycline resistance ribosomal protection protein [Paenibacillus lignilyticus]
MGAKMRNVGIFAHVDAGKTTTTEQMLYQSGHIRALGSVDTGTTQTDWLDVERERGISVRAAVTRFAWKDTPINLVDTPGHVDFLSEVERSLRVMDGAVLIVSAVEGVQAQTEVIWQALRDLSIPTMIYVNKMDRVGADALAVLDQLQRLLSRQAVPVAAPIGAEAEFAGSLPVLDERALGELVQGERGLDARVPVEQMLDEHPWAEPYRRMLVETVAEQDESLLEAYLEGQAVDDALLRRVLVEGVHRSTLFPVLFGASNRGLGVKELMDAVLAYLPAPGGSEEAPVSGVIFKMERDPVMGKIAYVRLFEGIIRNRDTVLNYSRDMQDKVTQIRRVTGQKTEDIGVLKAGDIAAVYGWSRARIGDVIGAPEGVPGEKRLAVPLLTVQVQWKNEAEYPAVVAAFQELADEDPLLDLQWLQDERELHLKVMGPIQMEVLTSILLSRFKLEVSFGAPSVIYKETPASVGEGYVAYLMPKPCWAILRFTIEPGERGSGIVYKSLVRNERLLESYQNEVARRVPEALQQGLRGWEVTDLRVTLIEGEHHVWHTHPLDFVIATPMGIMNGLANTGTKLLEPLLHFRLSVPEEYGGKLMNELVLMRGEFDAPIVRQERMELEGTLPVATTLDFPARLGSMTKGRGTLTTFFAGYRECPPDVDVSRQRRGVNPLDQAKYILAVRNALSG